MPEVYIYNILEKNDRLYEKYVVSLFELIDHKFFIKPHINKIYCHNLLIHNNILLNCSLIYNFEDKYNINDLINIKINIDTERILRDITNRYKIEDSDEIDFLPVGSYIVFDEYPFIK